MVRGVLLWLACSGGTEPGATPPGPAQPLTQSPCAPSLWHRDLDGDGVGSTRHGWSACEPPEGYVASDGDCDDTDPARLPGAPEVCDGIDNDCDGIVDEDVRTTVFRDADGDGHGDPYLPYLGCPADGVARGTDCDDTDPTLHPRGPHRFVEVTAEAGISGIQWDPADPPLCVNDPMAGGAAVGDVDGDGWPDLFYPRMYSPDLLFLNQGDGSFAEAGAAAGVDSEGSSGGAVLFDADGDDDLDLFVTAVALDRHRLYINDGTGHFTEEALARGVADPVLQPYTCAFNLSVSAADVDADGDLDLHVTAWQEEDDDDGVRARLFLNDGAGSFTDGTQAAGLSMPGRASFTASFVDVDADADPDLLLTADWTGSGLWRNDGGRFVEITASAGVGTDDNGMGSAVGDPDNDGDPDWFVASIYDETDPCPPGWGCTGNRLYRNEGGARFLDVTDEAGVRDGGWGWGAVFADLDLDGHEDLIQTGGFPVPQFDRQLTRVWRNLGGGRFEDGTCATGLLDVGQGRAVVPIDHDLDGDLDLFVVGHGETPSLWRNDRPASAHWLVVEVRGGAPSGIGARVEAWTHAGRQTRWIHANSTFGAVALPVAHFGLADARQVEALVVTWPDGTVRTWQGLAADQRFVATP